jgi:hypothetical protein
MARLLLRNFTFSNVCSFLALFIALSTGTAYAANTIGSDDIIDNSIASVDVKNAAITSNDLQNGGVKAVDLGADSVDSTTVLDESLTAADLGTNSVNATEIADSSIDSGEIVNDSLFDTDLASGSVRTDEILDGNVGNADLASNAVTGSKVASNTLTTADIAGADVNGGAINVPTGYVPNGRCRQLDASVGGATAGEAVVFSTKAALQDGVIIYGQRVPSNGHVTFSVCNFSGTTQAAISDMPVRLITFG